MNTTMKFALIMVGQTFRNRWHFSCISTKRSIKDQMNKCDSYVRNVINPLETAGSTVDVVLSMSDCNPAMNNMLRSCYGDNLIASKTIHSQSISDGWTKAWKLYESTHKYHDFVLQMRNDIEIMRPITVWNLNFSRILYEQQCVGYLSGCECPIHHFEKVVDIHENPTDPHICVRDKLLGVPKTYLAQVKDYFTTPPYLGGHNVYKGLYGIFNTSRDMAFMFPHTHDNEDFINFHRGRDLFYHKTVI